MSEMILKFNHDDDSNLGKVGTPTGGFDSAGIALFVGDVVSLYSSGSYVGDKPICYTHNHGFFVMGIAGEGLRKDDVSWTYCLTKKHDECKVGDAVGGVKYVEYAPSEKVTDVEELEKKLSEVQSQCEAIKAEIEKLKSTNALTYEEWARDNPKLDAIVRLSESAYQMTVSDAVDSWVNTLLLETGYSVSEFKEGVELWEKVKGGN